MSEVLPDYFFVNPPQKRQNPPKNPPHISGPNWTTILFDFWAFQAKLDFRFPEIENILLKIFEKSGKNS